jgi:transcriptional regulator with XRE-family HTH domain
MTTANEATPAPREAMTIELNRPIFEKVARSNGWTTGAELAEVLGMSERQVSRIRSGTSRPGIDFIAGLLSAVEESGFRRLFRIVPKSESIGKD